MARFAGDIFGSQGQSFAEDSARSVLLDYFPDLRDLSRSKKTGEKEAAPQKTGGFAGIPEFAGAKPLQSSALTPVPVFAGSSRSGYKQVE
jgi:hypothetical protein